MYWLLAASVDKWDTIVYILALFLALHMLIRGFTRVDSRL